MIVLSLAFYQHVVNINLDISPNLLYEHLIHEPLIRRACVFETKWHYFIVEEALASNERSFLLICFIHSDLVVTRKSVHET